MRLGAPATPWRARRRGRGEEGLPILLVVATGAASFCRAGLPPVSYLTRLDVYTMSSLIYLAAVMGAHGYTAFSPAPDAALA